MLGDLAGADLLPTHERGISALLPRSLRGELVALVAAVFAVDHRSIAPLPFVHDRLLTLGSAAEVAGRLDQRPELLLLPADVRTLGLDLGEGPNVLRRVLERHLRGVRVAGEAVQIHHLAAVEQGLLRLLPLGLDLDGRAEAGHRTPDAVAGGPDAARAEDGVHDLLGAAPDVREPGDRGLDLLPVLLLLGQRGEAGPGVRESRNDLDRPEQAVLIEGLAGAFESVDAVLEQTERAWLLRGLGLGAGVGRLVHVFLPLP